METKHNQDYHDALAVSRDIFEQSVNGIDAEIKRLQEQRKLVEQDYKKRNEGIHKQYNSPTEHSIASRRMRQAFNIKRCIGGKLLEWQSPVIDAENAQVQFEMKQDHIAMSVIIPFKSYELSQH